jgi:hypothetical protein
VSARVRLWLPSVVLLLWTLGWSLGLRGDATVAGALVALTVAVGFHAAELDRRYVRRGNSTTPRH